MLKIIEKAYANHPIHIFAKPGVKLIAGYACVLEEYNGNLVCNICTPAQSPFGIIGKSKYIKSNKISFNKRDMVTIWHQRMIFRTDNFENSNYYAGDKLYVGSSGMLTNERFCEESRLVARLTGYPDEKRDYFEALWL